MLLPARVLATLFGFSDERGPRPGQRAQRHDRRRASAPWPGSSTSATSMAELLADQHARRPADDVASRMLARSRGGFTDEEIVQDLMVMMAAGHQPTADWIGNSLRLMLTDDRFAASLSGGRHSVAEAMNEVLWEDTPTQNVAGRWASRDTQLGGRRIRAGDLLLLGFAARQRRPAGPHRRLRADRRQQRLLLLRPRRAPLPVPGPGDRRGHRPHRHRGRCWTGCPDIDLAVPAEQLTRRPSPWLRGLTGLPVRFTPDPRPWRPVETSDDRHR